MARHRIGRCLGGSLAFVVAGLAAVGCASSEKGDADNLGTTRPHLMALSTYAASLGQPIDAFIANPPTSDAQKIELVFEGTFKRAGGGEEHVSMTQATQRTEAGAVRWTQFGPFANPFAPKDADIGAFDGTVGVRVTNADGSITDDEEPLPVHFEVQPSIMITELQPTTASCDHPSYRLIGAMRYKMKAQTIGFKPTSIEYSIQTPGVIPDEAGKPALDVGSDGQTKFQVRKLSHTMATNTDAIDDQEAILLPPVPTGLPSYGVVVSVIAKDAEGRKVSSVFGMTAHNPLEVFYDGRFQLAQIYGAKPVSSCMSGGQSGRSVNYSESQTETKQRTLSVTLSKTFVQSKENNWSTSDGKTISTSTTETDGYSNTHSTSNSFSFTQSHSDTSGVSFNWADTNSETHGWEAHGEAEVGFSLFGTGGKAKAGGGFHQDWTSSHTTGGDQSQSSSDGWSQGTTNTTMDSSTVNHSTATTDSTAVTKTNTEGGSDGTQQGEAEAETDAWTVSSSQTIQKGFSGNIIANTYGVFYRQMARYTERAFVLVYDKCGEGDVIGDLTLQDYVWAPDLALSEACPPLPQTNLPAPQCYLPPCDP